MHLVLTYLLPPANVACMMFLVVLSVCSALAFEILYLLFIFRCSYVFGMKS